MYSGFQRRSEGTVLIVSIMTMVLLAGLATAQFAVSQKNLAQSRFYIERSEIRYYAESGVNIGVHEVTNRLGENAGFIGTVNWTLQDDVGADGLRGTADEGEGDGLPTPGEPNLLAEQIGPLERNSWVFVYSEDIGGGITRVISTAYDDEHTITVERHVELTPISIPLVGLRLGESCFGDRFSGKRLFGQRK